MDVFTQFTNALRYKLWDQWHFAYFAHLLDRPVTLPRDPTLTVRRAVPDDLPRIARELTARMRENPGDAQYFVLLGTPGAECFLVEQGGTFVHFTWLFTDLTHAPIMRTPLARWRVRAGDAFIGPLYTRPDARGAWIFPTVLAHVLSLLRERATHRRALVFVHVANPGAVRFYERFGFERI